MKRVFLYGMFFFLVLLSPVSRLVFGFWCWWAPLFAGCIGAGIVCQRRERVLDTRRHTYAYLDEFNGVGAILLGAAVWFIVGASMGLFFGYRFLLAMFWGLGAAVVFFASNYLEDRAQEEVLREAAKARTASA